MYFVSQVHFFQVNFEKWNLGERSRSVSNKDINKTTTIHDYQYFINDILMPKLKKGKLRIKKGMVISWCFLIFPWTRHKLSHALWLFFRLAPGKPQSHVQSKWSCGLPGAVASRKLREMHEWRGGCLVVPRNCCFDKESCFPSPLHIRKSWMLIHVNSLTEVSQCLVFLESG